MIECKICNTECVSLISLSKHIHYSHNLSSIEYYNTYIDTSSNLCPECQINVRKFISLGKGYSSTCSHKCKMTLHRRNLKNDTIKFSSFVDKVKVNMVSIHKNMDDMTKSDRSLKIKNKVDEYVASLTQQERVEIFGWMNKLDNESKQEFIKNVMLKTGCHQWWKTASEEDKELARDKAHKNSVKSSPNIEQYVEALQNLYVHPSKFSKLETKLGMI